jgi:uncharacterized protein YegJ (DUF2314 family)
LFGVTIYYSGQAKNNLSAAFGKHLAAYASDIRFRDRNAAALPPSAESEVFFLNASDVAKDAPPPTADSLRYFGRGLSQEQAAALATSKAASLIGFRLAPKNLWRDLRTAHRAIMAFAEETGGYIWDGESREAFTPASFRARRLDPWKSEVPDVTPHYKIHLYRNNDYLRAVTVGMIKFGLPDLVVQETVQGENEAVGSMIQLLAQRLAEAPARINKGAFDLRIADVREPVLRESIAGSLKSGGTGELPLCLYSAKPDKGDADNFLIEIGFERMPGRDRHAQRHALLAKGFGMSSREILPAQRGDVALEQASRKARSQLPSIKSVFAKGLAPGERILLKAPFGVGRDTEYMWVEASRWGADGSILGLLMNDPKGIANLHAGQEVRIKESDVYDYIRVYPDGRREGNETGRILQERASGR